VAEQASGRGAEGVGVTAAQGFRAAGLAAGIKSSGAPDLALVVNCGPSRWSRPASSTR
jgi:glutamate N-acetyltransferase/amino-acid N-acetyltransferase